MEVRSILAFTELGNFQKSQQTGNLPKYECCKSSELVSSKASLAARSYVTSQINFGSKTRKLFEQITSGNKMVDLEFRRLQALYEELGFIPIITNSGAIFRKEGFNPISVTKRGSNVDPAAIRDIRKHLGEIGCAAHI